MGKLIVLPVPENSLIWVPYNANEILKFSSGEDTIQFIVTGNEKTEAYSINNKYDCSCEYHFIKYGYSEEYYSVLRSDDFYFSSESEIIPELIVENLQYQNVIKIELDTIDDNSLNW